MSFIKRIREIDQSLDNLFTSFECSLCGFSGNNIECVERISRFDDNYKRLRAILGDRLMAFAFACDDLTQIKNQFDDRKKVVASLFVSSLENYKDNVLDKYFILGYANRLRSLFIKPSLHDVQTPAERLICQVAGIFYPQVLLPRTGKYDKYAQAIWVNNETFLLDDIMQENEKYVELLLLLTNELFFLGQIFTGLKSENEYRELVNEAKSRGTRARHIFKDLNFLHGPLRYFHEIPYNIISNLTYSFTNNINNDVSDFTYSALQEFRSFISLIKDKKIKIRNVIGLNVFINGEKSIGNKRLRPITDSDKRYLPQDMVAKCSDGSTLAVYEQESEVSIDLFTSITTTQRADIVDVRPQLDQHIDFMKISAAITLAHSDYIVSRPDFDFSKYNFHVIQSIFAFSKHALMSNTLESETKKCRSEPINDEIIAQASIHLNKMNALSDDGIYSLLIPMFRLLSTKQDILLGDIDTAIDAMIVWESLLGSSDDKLAEAINGIGIASKNEVKRLRKIRNQIVHGDSKLGEIIDFGNHEGLSKLKQESILKISGDLKRIKKIALDLFKYIICDDELKHLKSSKERVKHILAKGKDKIPSSRCSRKSESSAE